MTLKLETKNILIVTENLEVGGAEKYTVLLANELYERGHRVVVLANEGPFRKHFDPDIRFVRAFFEHGFLGVLYGAFQMIRISFQENISFIHAQKLQSSQAAWLARFITRVPVVKTAHGYTPKELAVLGKVIDKYSDKVVTVVDWLLPELSKNGVQENKLSVIYNGTVPSSKNLTLKERRILKMSLGIDETDRVVVSMARLERGKNYKALIEWFVPVIKQVPNTKLVIVGDGPEKINLIKEASDLGLTDSVIFVEATTQISKYLQIADIFCTPSVARGMAVLEAMEASLPVVGIKPLGQPQVVLDGQTGFVISKDNGSLFAKKVIELLLDPKLAKRFGQLGKKRVSQEFPCSDMVDQLENVYRQVVA